MDEILLELLYLVHTCIFIRGSDVVEGPPDTIPHVIQETSSCRAARSISTRIDSLDNLQDASIVTRTAWP